MGRPKQYATAAEKQAAFRARSSHLEIRTSAETLETVDRMAQYFGVSRSEVAHSLLNFALLNRNWFTLGLFGKRLPPPSNESQIKDFESFMDTKE